jgi:hypothetical protein
VAGAGKVFGIRHWALAAQGSARLFLFNFRVQGNFEITETERSITICHQCPMPNAECLSAILPKFE